MSKLIVDHVFTSESVSEGHPDKLCDLISDAILDECLKHDPKSRVACETAASTNFVINIGEITCDGWSEINPEEIARNVVREVVSRNANLPVTEAVKITTMAGCSAVKK